MSNTAVFRIQLTDQGKLKRVTTQVEQLGQAVNKTNAATKAGAKGSKDFYDTQAKGIIGTANGTKSFSKMAQTIGSGQSNGLVAAYATLAANVFAATAAFNALNTAAKNQQVLAGLQQLGNRTGRTLTIASQKLKQLSGQAISTGQSMRYTAQIFSAGFNSEQLQRLGKLANDTSVALGRNMTDALDRLVKGTSKLQPQLLDELGIITKVGQATAKYANQMGKSVTALSSFQRTQAFMNAVLQQGQRKFGGISDAAGNTKGYDKLISALSDLATNSLIFINKGLLPLVQIIAGNRGLLTAGVLLFAASISKAMLPSLANMSGGALRAAQAQKRLASDSANSIIITGKGSKVYRQAAQAFQQGNRSISTQQQMIRGLSSSLEAHQRQIGGYAVQDRVEKQAKIDGVKQQIAAVRSYQAAQRGAFASIAGARATQAASQLSLLNIHQKFPIILKQLGASYRLLGKQAVLSAQAGAGAFARAKIGLNALAVTARVAGAAFLSMIPIVGQVVFAFSILSQIYSRIVDYLTSDQQKNYNQVMKQYQIIIQGVNQKAQKYLIASRASANVAAVQQAKYTILSNTSKQLTQSFDKVIQAQLQLNQAQDKGSQSSSGFSVTTGLTNSSLALTSVALLAAKQSYLQWANQIQSNSPFQAFRTIGGSADIPQIKFLQTLYKSQIPQLAKAAKDAVQKRGGIQALAQQFGQFGEGAQIAKGKLKDAAIQASQALKDFQNLGAAVSAVGQAFKDLQTQTSTFIQAAAISTPFDGLAKSFDAVSQASGQLSVQLLRAQKPAGQILDSLAQIGEQSKNFLSIQAQTVISDLSSINGQLARVQQQLQSAQGQQRTDLLSLQRSLKGQVDIKRQSYQIVVDSLNVTRQLVLSAQQQSRLAAGRLKIHQAQLSSVSSLFQQTVAGYRAKIQGQQKAVALQNSQLQIQKSLLQSLLAQSQIKVSTFQLQIQAAKQQKIQLQLTKQRFSFLQQIHRLTNIGYSTDQQHQKAIKQSQLQIASLQLNKQAVLNSQRDLKASITALAQQQAALSQKLLTAQQKASAQYGIRVTLSKRYQTLQNQRLSKIAQIQQLNGQIVSHGKQQNTLITQKINSSRIITARAIDFARRQAQQSKRQLQHKLRIAKADGNRANTTQQQRASAQKIKDLNNQIQANQKIADLQLLSITRKQQLFQLQQVSFNTKKQGIQWQQKGIQYLLKQQQAYSDIATTQTEILQKRKQAQLKSRGLQANQNQTNAFEVQAALTAYNNAVAQVGLKFSLIDAQYALLDAQKTLLLLQLSQRKSALQQWGIQNNKNVSQQVQQIQNAINLNSSFDTGKGAQLQKKAILKQVQSLRLSLHSARLPQFEGGNPVSTILQGIRSIKQIRQARQAADRALQTPINQLVNSGIQLVQADNIAIAIQSIPQNLTKKLQPFFQQLASSVLDSQAKSLGGSSSEQIAHSINGRLKQLGLEGSRHSIFNGGRTITSGHSRGSRHYSDRAVDVNAPGNIVQANSQKWAAVFDKLAVQLKSQGFDVLWRTQGHFDHLHVSWTQAMQRQAKAAGQQLQKVVADLVGKSIVPQIQQTKPVLLHKPHANDNSPLPETAKTSLQNNVTSQQFIPQQQQIVVQGIKLPNLQSQSFRQQLDQVLIGIQYYSQSLRQLGPQGQLVFSVIQGAQAIANSVSASLKVIGDQASTTRDKFNAVATTLSAGVSVIQNVTAASAAAKVANIQKQIDIQQTRDGQSATSVAKLAQLNKKKQGIQRKAFNNNKKLAIAQAVIATATGVAQALKLGFPLGPIMGTLIGALGAAQIAAISSTSYAGGGSAASTAASTASLSIGKRGDSVDLAKNNPNAGGQIGFLRGSRGTGSNASDFSVIGSPYGGDITRGYGNRTYLTGEKGPQQVDGTKVKSNAKSQMDSSNVTPISININALDAKSVQQMFKDKTGTIITSIRQAANSKGIGFIQGVNKTSQGPKAAGTKA